MKSLLIILSLLLFSCAGPNPNPGERTADYAWVNYNYSRNLEIINPAAKNSEPWAQLRLGYAYEYGEGVDKNISSAIYWYNKAAIHTSDGDWENGKMIGAVGKAGHFNQNSDALIAKYMLSGIYFNGEGVEQDLVKAYILVKKILEITKGADIFFCCEFNGGKFINATMINKRLNKIMFAMSDSEIKKANLKLGLIQKTNH